MHEEEQSNSVAVRVEESLNDSIFGTEPIRDYNM